MKKHRIKDDLTKRNQTARFAILSAFIACGALWSSLYAPPALAKAVSKEPRRFTIYTVEVSGVKMWVPSTIVVHQGDQVEIKAVVKTPASVAGAPNLHGITLPDFNITETTDENGKTLTFVANKVGVFNYSCHLHPAHVGGQLVVLK